MELLSAWEFDPLVVVPLMLSGWIYARGLQRIWQEAGPGHGVRTWEAAAFLVGWLALVLALVSPLHPWSNVLFSVHMTQHEILMLVVAPLVILGRPMIAVLKALPPGWPPRLMRWTRFRAMQLSWHVIRHPLAAWLIHMVALWVWHIPVLFAAALQNEFIHALQHLGFLLSALLFWWTVLEGSQGGMGYGVAVLYLFTTALHSGLLGALITLARVVWYPNYAGRTEPWGLAPLEDQQLGGLIMWIPACTVYIVAGLVLFAAWLRASEKRVRRWEAAVLVKGYSS